MGIGKQHFRVKQWAAGGVLAAEAYWLFLLLQPPVGFDEKNFFPVKRIKRRALQVFRDQKTGHVALQKEAGDASDFSVLQLTDVHLGGSYFSRRKDKKALLCVARLLKKSRPDLAVVTGDLVYPAFLSSFSFNNGSAARLFCEFMERAGIYWTITYGNHDTEPYATHNAAQLTQLLKRYPHCLLCPEKEVYGRSNQVVELRNGDNTLNQALVLVDSHSYRSLFQRSKYDYIRKEQVDWYEDKIRMLNRREKKVISSMVFFHIPLKEVADAWRIRKVQRGEKRVRFHFGKKREAVACSKERSDLFRRAVLLGSTKAMFFGHDHLNHFSLTYQGIRLTYGRSIDYLAYPGIEGKTGHRGGIWIRIHPDSSFHIQPLDGENGSKRR